MSTESKPTPATNEAMTSYHFDIGDSTQGPLGLCARIVAPSRERALEILKETLPETIEISIEAGPKLLKDGEEVQYANVYVNTGAMSVKDSSPSNDEKP